MRGGGDKKFAWRLAAIVAVGAVVRVVFAYTQQEHLPLLADSIVYTAGAEALAQGKGWIDPWGVYVNLPTASHPPLYMLWLWIPAFLADGHHVSQFTSMLWSCVLGTGTVLMCGLAGREIAGRRMGLAAGALAAVYPGLWVYDGILLSETMAMFTATGVILFAYRYKNHPSWARVAWLGFWCGLAALSRSELVLSFVFVLVPLVLLTKDRRWTIRVGWLAMAGAIGIAVISPWIIFNAGRFHQPVYISSSSGRTMASANCSRTYGGELLGFKSYECLQEAAKPFFAKRYDETDRDKELRAVATDYMENHASRVPVVVAWRWGRLLQILRPRQEIQLNFYYHVQGRVGTELQFWSFYLVAGSAIIGAFVLRRRRIAIFPLLAFPAIALIAVATTFAQWRYRAVGEPALVLLAAAAFVAGWERFVARRRGDAVLSADPVPEPSVSRT